MVFLVYNDIYEKRATMDTFTKKIEMIHLQKTKEALIKNNMEAIVVENKQEALALLQNKIEQRSHVSVGGSMSLFECGVIDLLQTMDIHFDDRYDPSLTREDIEAIYRRAFCSDYYIASSNAVTLQGELYNVDGNANRVAAISYGPKQVILIVGKNKIVKDLGAAIQRVNTISAPANCARLHLDNACTHTGQCMDCQSESRICCTYTVHKRQRVKNRICVILINEILGY